MYSGKGPLLAICVENVFSYCVDIFFFLFMMSFDEQNS